MAPIGWGINPNLIERFPIIFDMIYANPRENDYFTTAITGAGVIDPNEILEPRFSGLSSGESVWVEHNKYYNTRLNMKFTRYLN